MGLTSFGISKPLERTDTPFPLIHKRVSHLSYLADLNNDLDKDHSAGK